MPTATQTKSARTAAAEVLRRAKHPLKTKEITERVLRRSDVALGGATPEATMAAILSVENLKRNGMFKRVAPGTYALRPAPKSRTRRAAADEPLTRETADA